MEDPPIVTVLLLGDPGCGKTTFLSKLSLGRTSLRAPTPTLPLLREENEPHVYTLHLYSRPYTFHIHTYPAPSSPHNPLLLPPSLILLCYDISSRSTLTNLKHHWFPKMVEWFMKTRDDIPVMVLGLKRDLRVEGAEEGTIYPQEGHRVAGEVRADMYAECSAVTGELMEEVLEDLARKGAKTTTENGGKGGDEAGCGIM